MAVFLDVTHVLGSTNLKLIERNHATSNDKKRLYFSGSDEFQCTALLEGIHQYNTECGRPSRHVQLWTLDDHGLGARIYLNRQHLPAHQMAYRCFCTGKTSLFCRLGNMVKQQQLKQGLYKRPICWIVLQHLWH